MFDENTRSWQHQMPQRRTSSARLPWAQWLSGKSTGLQRFSGCLTKIRSRNWRMRVSMAYWNELCTWSPSQSTVCSSLDRCHAYLRAGRLCVNGEGTYCALSRQCACTKILNGSWSSNLKTSVVFRDQITAGPRIFITVGLAHSPPKTSSYGWRQISLLSLRNRFQIVSIVTVLVFRSTMYNW